MIWKDIEGYEGRYQVSDTCLIKSCEHYHPTMIKGIPVMRHKKEQLLKQWKRSSYFLIDLWKDGKRDIRSVHVLVYETFNGPLKDNEVVHHIDFNKFNNSLDNLKKMTIAEHNLLHFKDKEPWNKGIHPDKRIYQKMWNTRGKSLKIRNDKIRDMYSRGESVKNLSTIFNICTRSIYDIVKGKTKC